MKLKASIATSITATVLFLIIQSLYLFSSISSLTLDIILVISTAVFILAMFITKALNKNNNIATSEIPKSTITGILSLLTGIAILADGVFQFSHVFDIENTLHILIPDESINFMQIIIITRCIFGFITSVILFLFSTSFFRGENKFKKLPFLITIPALWGCSKLFETTFIKSLCLTTAKIGFSIVGEIFLVLAIFSMSKIFAGANEIKSFKQFAFLTFTAAPIVLSSSVFGIYSEIENSTGNILLYISEIIFMLFIITVFSISKSQSPESSNEEPGKLVTNVCDWVYEFVSSAALVCLLLAVFFRNAVVDGESMSKTLHDKEKLVLYSFMYKPQNGDIVVIKPLQSMIDHNLPKKRIIKRVIATEGQTLKIDFNAQKVYVDGKEIDEPYTSTPMPIPSTTRFHSTYGKNIPATIPKGYIFVMGDNRGNSLDSRFEEIGLVPEKDVVGKAIFRFWPNRVGFL